MKTLEIQSKKDLPNNVEDLHTLYWELFLRYQRLCEQYRILSKQRFGQSSEKSENLDGIQLEISGLSEALGELEEKSNEETVDEITIKKHTRKRRHPGRNVIPDHIERKVKLLDVSDEEKQCSCCGRQKVALKPKEHTVIERIPAKYKATVFVRPVYGCPHCKDSISTAEPANLPIPKGIAGPMLLSFVIISKYLYHLPLYRIQRQIFHEDGIWFTRSTMVSWLRKLHQGISRIHKELFTIFKKSRLKHSDESPIKVRYPHKKGKYHTGQMWVGVGKDSSEGSPTAIFYYNKRHTSEAAVSFLKGSAAGDILMVDGLEAYNEPIKKFDLIELNCLVHGRRKFTDAITAGYKVDFAKKIVRKIGQLYRIERWSTKAKVSISKRLQLRQRFSKKILFSIKSFLINPGFHVLPERKIGIAINYMLNHWTELTRFVENGEYPLDNNIVEQIIRALTIGRKNWICTQSEAGAKWMAAWYSIIATCKLNKINPHEYIPDVIQRLPLRPENMSVRDLTPIEWMKNKNGDKQTMTDYPKG